MATRDELAGLRLESHEKRSVAGRVWIVLAICASLVGLLALAGWATGVFRADEPGADEQFTSTKTNEDKTTRSRPARFEPSSNTVAAGGYIEAKRVAVVLPERDGVVAKVHVTRGQRVAEDGLLLELDSDMTAADVEMAEAEFARAKARQQRVEEGAREEEIEAAHAEVEAAEAEHEHEQRDVKRLTQLAVRNAVTTTELEDAQLLERISRAKVEELRARERLLRKGNRESDHLEAKADVERAEAALRQEQVRLDQSRLRAPFAGVVTRIDLEPGEIVSLMNFQRGSAGIEIADVTELLVKVDVPEARIGRVGLGAPAEVVVNALGEKRLRGVVVEIAPFADRQSNTIEVAVRILEPPPLLRPDMSARVAIEIGKEKTDDQQTGR